MNAKATVYSPMSVTLVVTDERGSAHHPEVTYGQVVHPISAELRKARGDIQNAEGTSAARCHCRVSNGSCPRHPLKPQHAYLIGMSWASCRACPECLHCLERGDTGGRARRGQQP